VLEHIPLIIASVVVVMAALSAYAAVRSTKITQRESANRTRPWMGITSVSFLLPTDTHPGALRVDVRNYGGMPTRAVVVELSGDVETPLDVSSHQERSDFPPVQAKTELGVVFPDEPGDATFFDAIWTDWFETVATINFTGEINYDHSGETLTTAFRVGVTTMPPNGFQTDFKNTSAT
jgi:hypothetical protein